MAAALTAFAAVCVLRPQTVDLAAALGAETPIPPSPQTWVTDNAGLLSASARQSLDERLATYERSSGHQVIVWIGQTTGDAPLEDWTSRAFSTWKIGRKKLDDGLALFVFTRDHKVRIEVGYGLEGQLTDATASRIIRNDIAPRLKAGDADGALASGVSAMIATIGGGTGDASAQPGADQAGQTGDQTDYSIDWLVLGIILVFLLLLFMSSTRSALGRMLIIGSNLSGGFGSRGGWGFSGGGFGGGGFGGFSGGGGMGGGGGASGSW
ncbi:MAG: TPM domain-containing protein [Candidatus Eremiobacteraeota bacterium]|nr:TPM domain-containing protein [Candidatus Eremiobacteraeota bacterium]